MNSQWFLIRYISALLWIFIPFASFAQDQKLASTPVVKPDLASSANRADNSPHALITYIPPTPTRPSPRATDTGGTRSIKTPVGQTLTLLTPDTLVQTIRAQPILYWHLSQNTTHKIMFTLTELDAIKPLLEIKIKQPVTSGFHSLPLNDYGVTLQTDKIYEWSISLQNSDEPSSDDIVAKAFLIHINHKPPFNHQNTLESARNFAKSGLWYEALETIMGNHPYTLEDKTLLDARSDLLKQVGISVLRN